MNKIKYDIDLMRVMSLFESLTQARLKDCIVGEKQLIFIVNENEIGKAIGMNGVNARKMESILKKKIKIVEFSPDAAQFIQNFIYPVRARDIASREGIITIMGSDAKSKGLLIGRDSRNLNNLLSIAKRYFPVDEIKVV